MVNIYSIKEILDASDSILRSSPRNKDISSIQEKVLVKKDFSELLGKPTSSKSTNANEDIPIVLEKIISEAEDSQDKANKTINNRTEHKEKKNLLEENMISQKDLIDDLYKTFGKKIKKKYASINIRT